MGYRILDVTDQAGFERIPPCADPGFDHRSCDYWEDDQRGSKAARASWLTGGAPAPAPRAGPAENPFAPTSGPGFNPFAKGGPGGGAAATRPTNPFSLDDEEAIDNPFAPKREARPGVGADAPRKLQLLDRGLGVFGSYAKILEVDGESVAWCQFGPLSAYPRAQRVRDLYSQLPRSPLPAVITCIATTAAARRQGYAKRLILSVVDDLTGRGFSAVEAYPEPGARADATSAAAPEFWQTCGFAVAVADPRFPVVRREL
jgi:GNAT superfamily N-acetyltransferase